MSAIVVALCERAAQSGTQVLENLTRTEAATRDLERETVAMPFFVRGFLSSTLTKGSGQDVAAWVRTIAALVAHLQDAQAAVDRAQQAGTVAAEDRKLVAEASEHAQAERPRLERLVSFMEQAPAKIDEVPRTVLAPEQRGEILGAIHEQAVTVRAALAVMPELVEALRALSVSSAY